MDDNLPDLFWTALATWKGRVLTRDFETLKAKLEDFEVSRAPLIMQCAHADIRCQIECNFDEAAVCKWLKGLADELKAIDVSQFEEDVAQWRAWDANIVEQEEEKAVVTNKGLCVYEHLRSRSSLSAIQNSRAMRRIRASGHTKFPRLDLLPCQGESQRPARVSI